MSKEVKIALIGVAGAIIAAIIGGLFTFYSTASNTSNSASKPTSVPTATAAPKATADQTLSEFCLLVQANGLDTAYKLYSDKLKTTVSPAQFNSIWGKTLSKCTTNITSSDVSSAKGTIAATEFPSGTLDSYDVTLTKNNDGYWRIDSVQ